MVKQIFTLLLLCMGPLIFSGLLWRKNLKKLSPFSTIIGYLVSFAALATLVFLFQRPQFLTNQVLIHSLGLNLGFKVSHLSLLLSLFPLLGGFTLTLYNFLNGKEPERTFSKNLIIAFISVSTIILFHSNSILSFFLSLMLLSFSLFLAHFPFRRSSTTTPSLMTLTYLLSGSLAFFIGSLVVQVQTNSFSIEGMSQLPSLNPSTQIASFIFMFCVLLFGAIFPFQSWLSHMNNVEHPLNGLVQSSIILPILSFFLYQFAPLLLATPYASYVFIFFGLATLLTSGVMSVFSKSTTQFLTATTLWESGLICSLFGLIGKPSLSLISVILLSHFFIKMGLFLINDLSEKSINISQSLSFKWVNTLLLLALVGIPGTSGYLVLQNRIFKVLEHLQSATSQVIPVIVICIFILSQAIFISAIFRWIQNTFKTTLPTPIKKKTSLLVQTFILLLALPILIFGLIPTIFSNLFYQLGFTNSKTAWHNWHYDLHSLLIVAAILLTSIILILSAKKTGGRSSQLKSLLRIDTVKKALKKSLLILHNTYSNIQKDENSTSIKTLLIFLALTLSAPFLYNRFIPSYIFSGPITLTIGLSIFFSTLIVISLAFFLRTTRQSTQILCLGITTISTSLILLLNHFEQVALILFLFDAIILFYILKMGSVIKQSPDNKTPLLQFNKKHAVSLFIAVLFSAVMGLLLMASISHFHPTPIGLFSQKEQITFPIHDLISKYRVLDIWLVIIIFIIASFGIRFTMRNKHEA